MKAHCSTDLSEEDLDFWTKETDRFLTAFLLVTMDMASPLELFKEDGTWYLQRAKNQEIGQYAIFHDLSAVLFEESACGNVVRIVNPNSKVQESMAALRPGPSRERKLIT